MDSEDLGPSLMNIMFPNDIMNDFVLFGLGVGELIMSLYFYMFSFMLKNNLELWDRLWYSIGQEPRLDLYHFYISYLSLYLNGNLFLRLRNDGVWFLIIGKIPLNYIVWSVGFIMIILFLYCVCWTGDFIDKGGYFNK